MGLRQQARVVRHWLWLIVVAVVIASIGAFALSAVWPKSYAARATLLVGVALAEMNPSSGELSAAQGLSGTFVQLATTRPLLEDVATELGRGLTADQVRARVSAEVGRGGPFIIITAVDADPDSAAAMANAVAQRLILSSPAVSGSGASDQFIASQLAATRSQIEDTQGEVLVLLGVNNRTDQQEQQLGALQARLVTLRQTYAQLSGTSGSAVNLLTLVDPAVAPGEPSSPRTSLNVVLAALAALVGALALAFVLDFLDDTIKSPDDVGAVAQAPALGIVARMRVAKHPRGGATLAALSMPRSSVAEEYRALRTNLEFASIDKPVRSLLVTSAVPGEGKTTTSANVAIVFAQAGRKVVLIDADMRRPSLHRLFELPNSTGLTNALRAQDSDPADFLRPTPEPNLRVLTTGALPPNPAELLGSQRMRELLRGLSATCDLVVVDTPPLHAVTDAAVLAAQLDGVLLVVKAGRTRRGAVRQAREALDRVNANLLGVALNLVSEKSMGDYYYRYYGEYYGEGSGREAAGQRPATSINPEIG